MFTFAQPLRLPTDSFTILGPQDQKIGEFHVVQERFLPKGQSGAVVCSTFSLRRLNLKRLNLKELTSGLVGLSFHGLEALSLSLLKTAGTTADKNGEKENDKHLSFLFCGYKH